jgi:hypothetical protein
MNEPNNPAGKLRQLLLIARDQNDNRPTWEVWKDLFKVDAREPHQVYSAIVKLNTAVDEITAMVRRHFAAQEPLLLKYQNQLRSITTPKNLEAPWGHYKHHISEHLLYNLEFCDNALRELYASPEFFAEIPKIKTMLAEIMNEISNSKLPTDIKGMLIERIESLLGAIEDYQQLGTMGIAEAMQSVVGVVAMTSTNIKANPENKVWLDQLKKVLEGIDRYAKVSYTAIKAWETVSKLIDR